jgi:hypothetical protein
MCSITERDRRSSTGRDLEPITQRPGSLLFVDHIDRIMEGRVKDRAGLRLCPFLVSSREGPPPD